MSEKKQTLLYTPRGKGHPMRVAGFMSGSGTNLVNIIEWEKRLTVENGFSPYEVVLLFTDNKASQGKAITQKWTIPFECLDILEFYQSRGHENKKDLSLRPLFDQEIVKLLEKYRIHVIALAGYMSIVTSPLLHKYPGRIINVHPADLTAMDGKKRKYTGDKAVEKAILAGEPFLYSSTHIVREEVDGGEILMISDPLRVDLTEGLTLPELSKKENKEILNQISSAHQNKLKETGDWIIFPYTLQLIAEGRIGLDSDGVVYIDGEPGPFRCKLSRQDAKAQKRKS